MIKLRIFTVFFLLPALFGAHHLTVPSSAQSQTKTANVTAPGFYNIRKFGAKGDGKTLDTNAINRAIETAAANGGGTIFFPAGTYLSFSIRLKSNITL